MRRYRHRIDTASGNSVNLPVQSSGAHRATRALHRRERFPGIARGIVFKCHIQCAHVNVASEPSNDVNLSIHSNRAGMTQTARHRRTLAPPIGRWIVFLHERLIVSPPRRTPKHINLSVDGSDRYLTARFRKPSLFRPSSLSRSLRNHDREDHQTFHIVQE